MVSNFVHIFLTFDILYSTTTTGQVVVSFVFLLHLFISMFLFNSPTGYKLCISSNLSAACPWVSPLAQQTILDQSRALAW